MTSAPSSPAPTPGIIRCGDIGVMQETVRHSHLRVPNGDVQVLLEGRQTVDPALFKQFG